MNWTYSGNPADSPLDEIRFLLGDTTQTPQSLSDDEIGYLIGLQDPANSYFAAADAANLMAGRFSRLSGSSKSVGNLSLSSNYGETANRYTELACKLMLGRTRFKVGLPSMGDDLPKQFSIGIHDQFNGAPFTRKDSYNA